ncbi:hypothetical protein PRIPAC_85307 [Pristionchus pacificus]|uniref:Uncharacterized protein n=1 Tax=Pristionchus pacificus TaxID=54126 RepID=A0A2A6BTE7_PRIPA|nr:hypothetical protein PRIPAC_85307 [Pristionchus pacificus]|eukprot:PDM69170.1 hypothetical protein PRIPAC_47472 [Pristionchus pacificus]
MPQVVFAPAGLTIQAVLKNKWVVVSQCWNLVQLNGPSGQEYETRDCLEINNGESCDGAGYICFGESRPQLVRCIMWD